MLQNWTNTKLNNNMKFSNKLRKRPKELPMKPDKLFNKLLDNKIEWPKLRLKLMQTFVNKKLFTTKLNLLTLN